MSEQDGYPSGISWFKDGRREGVYHLEVHRDGWDIEVEVSDTEGYSFWADRHRLPVTEEEQA